MLWINLKTVILYKRSQTKEYILYNFTYVTFLKGKITEMENTLGLPGLKERVSGKREVGVAIEGQHERFL